MTKINKNITISGNLPYSPQGTVRVTNIINILYFRHTHEKGSDSSNDGIRLSYGRGRTKNPTSLEGFSVTFHVYQSLLVNVDRHSGTLAST